MANNNSSKHEIILLLPEGDAGWQTWGEISGIACCDIFALEQETALKGIRNNFSGILVLPLFAKEKKEIVPFGLNFIKHVRLQKNYTCTPLFLVPSEIDMPPVPVTSKFVSSFAKKIIKNPSFGDDLKAVFFAELIYERGNRDENILLNLSNLTDCNVQDIKDSAKKLNKLSYNPELRELFYRTFVTFYKPFGKIEKGGHFSVKWTNFKKSLELKNGMDTYGGIDAYDILTLANKAYSGLNGIDQDNPHNVELELFRAPVPFSLQELVDAKKDIKNRLHEHDKKKTIKLLLIDNKLNKVKAENKDEGGLIRVLFGEEVSSLFELRMLGDSERQSIRETTDCEKYLKDEEKFNFKEFKDGLDEIDKKKDIDRETNYAWQVYKKIKESHFVLLDFFLNEEHTYLAFEFIQDIVKIRNKDPDYCPTIWYFITSAVYDSVVKYSQSGLLAEYYESAVVSAGDDPTNKKRQIIFLYKLLTFINARFANFKRYKDSIHEKLFADLENDEACNESQPYCKEYKEKESPPCDEEDCLNGLQNDIKRYLTEYDDVCSIFYDKKDNKDLKDIIESLDNVIKQFVWLPEADWYMIQHQIDFINNKLGGLQDKSLKKCKFSCKYILEELKDRSEVY